MIEYDGKSWLPILFRIRGSVIPRLLPRILFTAALGVIAVLLLDRTGFKISSVAHALVGVALGLLLVSGPMRWYDRAGRATSGRRDHQPDGLPPGGRVRTMPRRARRSRG